MWNGMSDVPSEIMIDLQGPKLRIGTFSDGPVELRCGDKFSLDLETTPGDRTRRATATSGDFRGPWFPVPTCCSMTARCALRSWNAVHTTPKHA